MKRAIVKFVVDATTAARVIAKALVVVGRALAVVLTGILLTPVALALIAAKVIYSKCKRS